MKIIIFSLLSVLALSCQANASLGLIDVIDLTLANNADLKSKQAQYNADVERLEQARAGVLPHLNVTGVVGKGDYSTSFVENQSGDFKRFRAELVQPLYAPKRFSSIEREQLFGESSETRLSYEQQSKSLQAAKAFLDLSRSQRFVQIAKDELADHKVKLERIKAMLDRGLATRMDTLEAQAMLDALKAKLVYQQSQFALNKKRLQKVIGIEVDSVETVNEDMWVSSKLIHEESRWFDLAENHSLAVKVAKKDLAVAQQDVQIQRKSFYPELNLRAEINNTDSYESTFTDNSKIQLELSMSLYEGGAGLSRLRAAKETADSKNYSLQDGLRQLRVQLKEVFTKLEASRASIMALEQSKLSNQAYLEAAEKGMLYGLRGISDVLEAKVRIYDNERQMVEEIYANINAQFEWLFLMGHFNSSTLKTYLSGGVAALNVR